MRIKRILATTIITAIVVSFAPILSGNKTTDTVQEESETVKREEAKIEPIIIDDLKAEEETASPVKKYYEEIPLDEDIQVYLYDKCKENHIYYGLVLALIERESYYTNDIISVTNDYGLMQINAINHQRITEAIGVTNYLDPYQNIDAGIYILQELFNKYEDVSLVLMAYNLGENGARRLWNQGIYITDYSNYIITRSETILGGGGY